MPIEEILSMQKKVMRKLVSSIAMLLISAILLSTSTYAYLVLSTEPEVREMKTTAGSNGYLEIALLGTQLSETGTYVVKRPENAAGQSVAMVSNLNYNNVWGNLVDLAGNYGLESIQLTPARLNLNVSGTYVSVNTQYPLSSPVYGTDGRISRMDQAPKTHYDADSGLYEDTANWGVNVIGFKDELNDTAHQTVIRSISRDAIRREAVDKVYFYRQSIRQQLIQSLENESDDIFAVINKTCDIFSPRVAASWDQTDAACVRRIANMLMQVASESDTALRWALLAYCAADSVHYDADNAEQMHELSRIYKDFLSMPLLPSDNDPSEFNVKSVAQANGYTGLVQAIDSVTAVKERVAAALAYLASGDTTSVGNAGACIISTTNSYILNGTPDTLSRVVAFKKVNGETVFDTNAGYYKNFMDNRTEDTFFFVGSGSTQEDGLFQAMAKIVGDYTSTLQSDFIGRAISAYYGVQTWTYDLKVTSVNTTSLSRYNESANIGALGDVYRIVSELQTSGEVPLEINRFGVHACGYQVDLSFRSNETGSLLLQQEALDRVTGKTEEEMFLELGRTNVPTQGQGSGYSFTVAADLTEEQAEKLLKCIRLVFMTPDGQIYAVGVPGTLTLKNGEANGSIRLFSVNQAATAETGLLTLGSEMTSGTITSLQKDYASDVSVLVYLDGDEVSGAFVSSRSASLRGTLNLQFTSSAELSPMSYWDYKES